MISRRVAFQIAILVATALTQSLAAADEGNAPQPPRFEGSLEPKLPKAPLAAVVIEGNGQIKTEQILKLIKTKAGQVPNVRQVREDVRALLTQSWFFDVETRVDQTKAGAVLVYIVSERPTLARITYAGNKQIDGKELAEFVERSGVTVGRACDQESKLNAAARIEEHYRRSGYVHAKVEVAGAPHGVDRKSDAPNSDEREVIFHIDEGPKVSIAGITFVGNKSHSARDLKSLLESTISGSWFSDGTYCPHTVDEDVVSLRHFYQNRGFGDVQVKRRETFSSNRSRVHLEFQIEEGGQYRIRNIEFTGNESIDENKLREGMLLRVGDLYDRRVIDVDHEKMNAQFAQLGYLVAKVAPRVRKVEGSPRLVDLTYEIDEGEQFPVTSAEHTAKIAQPQSSRTNEPTIGRPKQKRVPDESPEIRDVEQIEFVGVQSFDVDDLRVVLSVDFDLHCAAHPRGSLTNFIEVLQREILAGYRHSGFPDAGVEACWNSATGQIEVRVAEGGRFQCGEIKVTGVPQALSGSIVEGLTTDRRPNQVLWKKGESAPFDEFTLARMRRRIEAVLAAEAGRFTPQLDIAIRRIPESQQTELTVNVREIGQRAVVGKIDITGAKRDSAAEVLKYLDLQPGRPYDSRLPGHLERRLWESGRYLRSQVVAKKAAAQRDDQNRRVCDLEIKLREFKEVPPLKDELPPADQALLKFREWLEQWARGDVDEDLVLTASTRTLEGIPNGAKTELRIVIAPNRGQTAVFDVRGSDGKPIVNVAFAAYADRFVLAAPHRHAKVVFPNSDGHTCAIQFRGHSRSASLEDDGTKPFRIESGISFRGRSGLKASVLGIEPRFSPAFLLSIAHLETSRSEMHGGICTAWVGNVRFQIDAASGRLLEFRMEDKTDGTIVCMQAVTDGLKLELARLEPVFATEKIAYDASSPWKSLCEFALDCWINVADSEDLHAGDSVRALRKLVGRWSPPAIGELFEVLDRPQRQMGNGFAMPSVRVGFSLDDLEGVGSLSRKNLVGFLLPAYHRLVPQGSSLWLVGRDAAMSWAAGDTTSNERLAETCESPEIGPVAELLLGSLASLITPELSVRAGNVGIRQLSAAAFRNDYRAILTDDSWFGKSVISLARTVRTLDDAELNALSDLLPPNAPRQLFVNSLRELKANPAQPVEAVLPRLLDRVWGEFLRAEVSAALRQFVTAPVLERERLHYLDQVRRASAEESEKQR